MKNKKILIYILIAVLVLGLGFLGYKKLFPKKEDPEALKIKPLDNIVKYEYSLFKNKSDLYKEYFEELKVVLNEKDMKEEDYAKTISKLFASDFYSLEEKLTNNDIGGLDFIHPEIKDNFVLKASDTLYRHVESNIKGDRKQELPKVASIEVKTAQKQLVEAGSVKDQNGYVVNVSVNYEKDLGFPKNVQLKLVHKDIKLFIIEVK